MCRFCHQHGEGKKWYLRAENYSEDLLNDLERRRFVLDFIRKTADPAITDLERSLGRSAGLPPWLRRLAYRFYESRYRRDHFGQIVPLEDLKQAVSLASSIVRMPCICRKNRTGRNDARYCLGLSLDPEKLLDVKDTFLESFRLGPNVDAFERLTPDEAASLLDDFDRKGLTHSLWTFKTPFIGGLCNCDRADCLAMVAYSHDFKLFFRAEFVAEIDQSRCIGCKACLEVCQFGALAYSFVQKAVFVDPRQCYGCGVCRRRCEQDAIRLIPRSHHPVAQKLW